ncbi:hypothetical protein NQ176_g2071 [Zarea fungicola]|uniref:Uncharacterized protein n=1 Tax=Zarea fungicola TaxID=93591 RepID=A0ACC1NPW5_9HYPO|nr:hypothetical protein NQ176_g2071 [Lecanicillium fungicola]
MAAFDPATDAISRNLFSGANSYDGFRQWSVLRKSARLTAQRSVMVVVVDDQVTDTAGVQRGLVVGYAIWFIPLAHCEEEDQSPPKKPQAVAGLDMAAVSVLREAMMKDELESFGDKGARDVWTLDSLGVDPAHQGRGIGRMLLDWGVQRAMEQEKDCYLVSTPSGLPLYQSAGFKPQREVVLFAVPHMSMMKWHTQS